MTGNHQVSHVFGIIGLGRFGTALAETLAENGQEVLALDNCENKVRDIQDKVQQALVAPILDKATLKEAGIQNCGTVIVCIGENVEASIAEEAGHFVHYERPDLAAAEIGRFFERIGYR